MGLGVIVGEEETGNKIDLIFLHVHYYHSITNDSVESGGLSRDSESMVDVMNTIYAKLLFVVGSRLEKDVYHENACCCHAFLLLRGSLIT